MLLYNTYDGKRADLWSLGCLMFWLLAGEEPFTAGIPPDLPQARASSHCVVLHRRQLKRMRDAPMEAKESPLVGTVPELSKRGDHLHSAALDMRV